MKRPYCYNQTKPVLLGGGRHQKISARCTRRKASSKPDPILGTSIDSVSLPDNFCIIEDRQSVADFADLKVDEIKEYVQARRNRIFLLLEEIRRLRIQERIKSIAGPTEEDSFESFASALPFLPPLEEKTMKRYRLIYAGLVAGIILFGGLVAPVLEVKMGLGGVSYLQFIQQMHLPEQLAAVDPIVASLCGGAVGVLTTLLIVEQKNADMQEATRCVYCHGSGYLMCATCGGTGATMDASAASGGQPCRCQVCQGSGKVMCPSCLCTGKQIASEHDPRIDPFDKIF